MKRLLRIGCSTFVLSLIPIVSWFLLGLTVDANLVNIFSLTYPIQFVCSLLICIFASGANIKQVKEKNENAVLSGMTLGIIVGAIVLGFFLIFVNEYISFMGMEVEIYRDFTIYSIIASFIRLIFSYVLEKLYFEEKDNKAYIHSIIFNLLNLVVLIGTSLITQNVWIIISLTLVCIGIYAFVLLIFQYRKFKLDFNILTNFKYESMNIFTYLLMFGTYFIGYSNAFAAGEEYVVAINFVALITDAQWDCCEAISTAAKIDISYDKYDFKQTMKNAFLFSQLVSLSSIVAFFALFKLYNVNLGIGLICLAVEVLDFCYNLISYGFEPYIQLKYSASKNTAIGVAGFAIRFVLSAFIPLAFCTQIGQLVGSFVIFFCQLLILITVYKINKDGTLQRKSNLAIGKDLNKPLTCEKPFKAVFKNRLTKD